MVILFGLSMQCFALAEEFNKCSCANIVPSQPYLGSFVYTIPGMKPFGTIAKIEILADVGTHEKVKTWSYEDYLMRVTTIDGNKFDHQFKAMYGYFDFVVPEKLFGRDREFIVLTRQTAKGTGVNTRVLEIWHVSARGLKLVYRRTIADYVTIFPTVQWEYCFRVTAIPDSDPLRADAGIELVLSNNPFEPSFYPKDRDGGLLPKYWCIAFDEGTIKEFPGETCYTAFWARRIPKEEQEGTTTPHGSQ